jgi:glycosyltransferase involved in cell wall biosynthesis
MLELVRRLDPARWTVHVAAFRLDGPWYGRADAHAASVTEFPVRSFRSPALPGHVRAFARWCRTHRLALVHAATLSGNLFGLAGAALARVPVRIGSQRGYDYDRSRTERLLQRAAYATAHRIVSNSAAVADHFASHGIPRDRFVIIPNGVAPSPFPRRPIIAVRRITMIGTLRTVKGHDVLIDAAPALLARHPRIHFEIVGGGPLLGALRERTEARGVAAAFTFHGHREDVAERVAESDIVVMPSRSEGLPNAILEAMAAGRAVVASAVGGIPEVIQDGATGILVPAGDPDALAQAIGGLADDPGRADAIGVAARAAAESTFSYDRMVQSYEQLYLDELTRRAHVAPAASNRFAHGRHGSS